MFRRVSFSNHSGFSIIELLVVIIVIGILLAITALAYPAYQERARDSKRKNDLSALATAYKTALADGKQLGGGVMFFFPNFGDPTLAGNVNEPSQPGGRLGELGYIKETIMDPTWQSEPVIDEVNLTFNYSGYTIISCINPDMGVYAVGRLEKPSGSDVVALNDLKAQASLLDGTGNFRDITDKNNCFYNQEETFGFADGLGQGLGYAVASEFSRIIITNPANRFNYAVYIK